MAFLHIGSFSGSEVFRLSPRFTGFSLAAIVTPGCGVTSVLCTFVNFRPLGLQ